MIPGDREESAQRLERPAPALSVRKLRAGWIVELSDDGIHR
jgi:hypothetical protein